MNLKKKTMIYTAQRSVDRCTAEKWKRKPKNKHNKFWLFVVRKQIIRLNSNYTQYAENSNRIRVNGAHWTLFTVHCSHMCPFINIFVSTGECAAGCVCVCFLFISFIRFTSNTIFVQFIIARCLFCFNKLPQNEFAITCSISSTIIPPGYSFR